MMVSNIQFKEEKVFNFLTKKKMENPDVAENPFEFGLGELHFLNAILVANSNGSLNPTTMNSFSAQNELDRES